MQTFLFIVAGVVIGLLVILGATWYWFKRGLSVPGKTSRQRSSLSEIADSLPPFRITLHPGEGIWDQKIEAFSEVIESSDFQLIGDYTIPEMGNLPVRGFCHSGEGVHAVVYAYPQVGLVVDLMKVYRHHKVTVTTAPRDGLEHPDSSLLICVPPAPDDDGIRAIWPQMLSTLDDHSQEDEVIPVSSRTFIAAFTSSYAAEMDWRIRRGGISVEEIHQITHINDQTESDAQTVQYIRTTWRSAIDQFIRDETLAHYLRAHSLSISEGEALRQRALVVHEQSSLQTLSQVLDDIFCTDEGEGNTSEQALQVRLRTAFDTNGAIEGFSRVQATLPMTRRFTKLVSMRRPWQAAIYLCPEPNSSAL